MGRFQGQRPEWKKAWVRLAPGSKEIEFFETKGKVRLKEDDHQRRWYRDFLDLVKDNQIFSTLLTPPEHAIDDADALLVTPGEKTGARRAAH